MFPEIEISRGFLNMRLINAAMTKEKRDELRRYIKGNHNRRTNPLRLNDTPRIRELLAIPQQAHRPPFDSPYQFRPARWQKQRQRMSGPDTSAFPPD